MTFSRVALATALLVTAAILQVTVANPMNLPGGGPDLVLLVLVGLAAVQGPLAGAVTGFFAGLLVDFVPPAAGHIGVWALVYCLVGYAAGHLRSDVRRSVLVILGAVAVLSAALVIGHIALALLFGESSPTGEEVTSILVGTVLYDLLLAPFVVPGVMWLARRAEPNPSRVAL